ncbi:MAG: hypothetical protein B7Z16_10945, partial [Algoriphagus sp. 32-45-6]
SCQPKMPLNQSFHSILSLKSGITMASQCFFRQIFDFFALELSRQILMQNPRYKGLHGKNTSN